MKANEGFLKAKNDKNVRSLIIVQGRQYEPDRQFMYVCIDVRNKYTGNTEMVTVETDTEIRIDNYSGYMNDTEQKRSAENICFHLSQYNENFVYNFLKSIKKDSDIKFKVVAFNGCDFHKANNLVSHQLYGIIDNKEYFLNSYTGADNSASPVK